MQEQDKTSERLYWIVIISASATAAGLIYLVFWLYTINVENRPFDMNIGPREYPDCQVTVSSDTLGELEDMGLWRWMIQCIQSKQ